MLDRAIRIAVKCHSWQVRKHVLNGHRLPYIVHPIEVMKTVWTWGAGETNLMAAAVLHDVLEDSPITMKQLVKSFGDEIAGIVQELTFDRKADGDKNKYLGRFATASLPALLVKLADRHCNLRDCRATAPTRLESYRAKSAVLLSIMNRRLPEISQRFGESVAVAIVAAFAGT
jgi:(p)ppGpp synthase/HD superfamily hydrolase